MRTLTSASHPAETGRKIAVVPFISALIVIALWAVILVSFPGMGQFPILHDTPIFHYIAERILLGDVPYRDILDINFPGVYLLHMLILVTFGKSDIAWASFTFLWLGLTAFAAGWYCWRISRLSSFLISAHIVGLTLSLGLYSFGQRDFFMMLFLFLALIFFSNALEGYPRKGPSASMRNLFGAGFFLGAASMIKPTPVVLLLVFAVILLFFPESQLKLDWHSWTAKAKKVLPKIVWLLAGTAVLPMLIFIWLLMIDGLNAFITMMLQYNLSIYISLYRLDFAHLVRGLLYSASPFSITFPILLIWIVTTRGKVGEVKVWLAVLLVAFGCFHYLYQAKGWIYQDIPFFMGCLLLQTILFGKLLQGKLFSQGLALMLVLPISLILASSVLHMPFSEDPVQESRPAVPLLVADMKTLRLTPQDRIQVMDAVEGGIHALFLLHHPQATRYIYDSLFIRNVNQPFVKNLQESFINDLQKAPPRYIVIFLKGPFPEEDGIERYKSFPQFLKLINNSYHPAPQREYYTIYEYSQ